MAKKTPKERSYATWIKGIEAKENREVFRASKPKAVRRPRASTAAATNRTTIDQAIPPIPIAPRQNPFTWTTSRGLRFG